MERLTGKELRLISGFLLELYRLRNHDEFTSHLLAALPTITEGEFTSYNEINHHQGSGTFKTDVTGFLENPEHFGRVLTREAERHPVLHYWEKTHDGSTVAISDFVSDREFRETALYRKFYQPLQIPRLIGFALQSGSQHSISIARHKNGRAFAERTRTILNAIRPHVLQGFQNALAVTRVQDQLSALDQTLEAGHQAMLSVTADGRMQFSTPHAQRLLSHYGLQTKRGTDRLPASLCSWLRKQVTQLQARDDVTAPLTPLSIDGKTGTLEIRLIPKDRHYLLLLQERRPAALRTFTHLGLSAREAEILGWVVEGKTNPEIGVILGISRRTVQKHLERIYIKLGVVNRTAAAAAIVAGTTQSTDR